MTVAREATFDTSLGTPPLAHAIDRQPSIVVPNTYLLLMRCMEHDRVVSWSCKMANCWAFLQGQIEHLVKHPELPADVRQTVLQAVLSDLQQAQHSL